MSDANIHNFVKQADGSILCSWTGCSAGTPGCRAPPAPSATHATDAGQTHSQHTTSMGFPSHSIRNFNSYMGLVHSATTLRSTSQSSSFSLCNVCCCSYVRSSTTPHPTPLSLITPLPLFSQRRTRCFFPARASMSLSSADRISLMSSRYLLLPHPLPCLHVLSSFSCSFVRRSILCVFLLSVFSYALHFFFLDSPLRSSLSHLPI